MEDRVFDSLVTDCYRAATGAMSWNDVMANVASAFRASVAFLHTADARDGRILSINYGAHPAPHSVLDYVREYHRHDPRRLHVLSRIPDIVGKWWHCHEHFDERFVANQRFYGEFMPSYNARYTSTVILTPGGVADPHMTAFALELPASRGVLDRGERDAVRRLGEAVQDALIVFMRMKTLAAQALAGHALLSRFAYPMWLIDGQRNVAYENLAAQVQAERSEVVARRGTALALVRSKSDRQLTDRLLVLTEKGHGASAVIDLRTTSCDPPTWLHLSAIEPVAALGVFGGIPQVLATLFDPRQVAALDPFALSSMFMLTPVEAKVAALLADGLTAAQIGEAHGTTVNTVRSQMREVITKLGARRAIDVVRLLRQGEVLWSAAGTARA